MDNDNGNCAECGTEVILDNASSIMDAHGTCSMTVEHCPNCNIVFIKKKEEPIIVMDTKEWFEWMKGLDL